MTIKKKPARKKGYSFWIDDESSSGEDEFESISRIRRGYAWTEVAKLQEACSLKDSRMTKILDISGSTLTRLKRKKANLELSPSDRFYRFRKIVRLAANVFEDAERGMQWLRRPQPGLKGLVPIEILDTNPGAEAVERLLNQIEFGILP